MTRLVDLLHSLTAVIIRYHDAHVSEKLIIESDPTLLTSKSRAYSPRILTDSDKGFQTLLNELITKCTNGYPARKHLLTYLVNEIVFLKYLLDRKQSFNPSELEQYKATMSQMLLNFKQLLLTTKSTTCSVKYSTPNPEAAPKIALNGLLNDSYYGSKFCFSGDLFVEVLTRFNLSHTSTDEEMITKAEILCTEHQNSLLIPELEQLNKTQAEVIKAEQAKVTGLTEQLKTACEEQSAQALHLEHALEKIKALEVQAAHQATLASETTIEPEPEPEPELLAAQRTIEEQAATISSLRQQLSQKMTPSPFRQTTFMGLGLYNPLLFSLKPSAPTAPEREDPTVNPVQLL